MIYTVRVSKQAETLQKEEPSNRNCDAASEESGRYGMGWPAVNGRDFLGHLGLGNVLFLHPGAGYINLNFSLQNLLTGWV